MHSERNLATNLSGAITMFLEGTRVRGRNVMVVGHNDGFQALASLLRRGSRFPAQLAAARGPASSWSNEPRRPSPREPSAGILMCSFTTWRNAVHCRFAFRHCL